MTVQDLEDEIAKSISDGIEVDLTTLPQNRVVPMMRRMFDATRRVETMAEAKASTRALMRSLHRAATTEGATGPLAGPGLIVALATQCSRTQGRHGDGMDMTALNWARAQA